MNSKVLGQGASVRGTERQCVGTRAQGWRAGVCVWVLLLPNLPLILRALQWALVGPGYGSPAPGSDPLSYVR